VGRVQIIDWVCIESSTKLVSIGYGWEWIWVGTRVDLSIPSPVAGLHEAQQNHHSKMPLVLSTRKARS
jgi:hypothetical protein